ncbi:MAG: DUF2911 domain-containing protein [Lacibacter sp.]
MKRIVMLFFVLMGIFNTATTQRLQLPDNGENYKNKISRKLALTDIDIVYNSPGVKGREGKIWGTDIAHYGFTVLGYGSVVESPWRAGADENTTISFSTDVTINGMPLKAGKYGFFIAVYPDSCTLIFNKNTEAWGSYFYNKELDVVRVSTKQQKDQKESKERLEYTFSKQTAQSVEVAVEWEHWRIPFTVGVDRIKTTLTAIQTQLSGALGFDPPALEAGAQWCLQNNVNYEQALHWINTAVAPTLGGVKTFNALSTKAGLLTKLGRTQEADALMKEAMETGTALEIHGYARQLLAQKKVNEAMDVFQFNYKKYKGAFPTNAGLMRGYSALGDLKNALKYAKLALAQSPDEGNKKALEAAIKTLEAGKAL